MSLYAVSNLDDMFENLCSQIMIIPVNDFERDLCDSLVELKLAIDVVGIPHAEGIVSRARQVYVTNDMVGRKAALYPPFLP